MRGDQIGQTYDFKIKKEKNFIYPPHLHFEVWKECSSTERDGYDTAGEQFKQGVEALLLDPKSFLDMFTASTQPTTPKSPSPDPQGLIGLLDKSGYQYLGGCGCYVWSPSRNQNQRHQYYLLTELGIAIGKRAWMNLDGHVTALSLLSTTGSAPNRKGSRFTEVYRIGGTTARISYVVVTPNPPGGEVTKYSITITVTKGGRSQTIPAIGECGC